MVVNEKQEKFSLIKFIGCTPIIQQVCNKNSEKSNYFIFF